MDHPTKAAFVGWTSGLYLACQRHNAGLADLCVRGVFSGRVYKPTLTISEAGTMTHGPHKPSVYFRQYITGFLPQCWREEPGMDRDTPRD
jgi:hypothetical protein